MILQYLKNFLHAKSTTKFIDKILSHTDMIPISATVALDKIAGNFLSSEKWNIFTKI